MGSPTRTIHYLVASITLFRLRASCACGEPLSDRTGKDSESPDSLYQMARLCYLEHARHRVDLSPGHTVVVPPLAWDAYVDLRRGESAEEPR